MGALCQCRAGPTLGEVWSGGPVEDCLAGSVHRHWKTIKSSVLEAQAPSLHIVDLCGHPFLDAQPFWLQRMQRELAPRQGRTAQFWHPLSCYFACLARWEVGALCSYAYWFYCSSDAHAL